MTEKLTNDFWNVKYFFDLVKIKVAIGGPDSFAAQSLIAIGGTASAIKTPQSNVLPRARVRNPGTPRRPLPCLFGKGAC